MKQQQLTFEKGISNIPSDNICSDNSLEDEIGMIYHNGEHRVIQNPTQYIEDTPIKVLFVHKVSSRTNFVGYDENLKLRWGTKDENDVFVEGSYEDGEDCLMQFSSSDGIQVNAIGKTLIVTAENKTSYFLFMNSQDTLKYKSLGDLPSLDINFGLSYSEEVHSSDTYSGIISINDSALKPVDGKQEAFDSFFVGLYSYNKKKLYRDKRFCLPFFACAAIKMFDGTYTRITNPHLLFPTVNQNSWSCILTAQTAPQKLFTYTSGKGLFYQMNTDLSDFSDIVDDVVIFITDGVEIYDTEYERESVSSESSIVLNGIYKNTTDNSYNGESIFVQISEGGGSGYARNVYKALEMRNVSAIKEDLCSSSIFYKLCSIGMKANSSSWLYTGDKFDRYTLENITTQERLSSDYYSNSNISGNVMSVYNGRLMFGNAYRSIFSGFKYFTPYYRTSGYAHYQFDVTIETSSKTITVRKYARLKDLQGLYFYYPDHRATHVVIYQSPSASGPWYVVLDKDLVEHEGLNGAFYMEDLPVNGYTMTSESATLPDTPSEEVEYLQGQIYQSEANNPFVFSAEGNVSVGNGTIIGISNLTQALSQGQFGQYPIIVFSDDGIWAAYVGSTGVITSVHPMSREVALKDNPCITQTDGAVFFASKKGLMVVIGSEVRCMSEQLNGKSTAPFASYLEDALIAYDYRDSLLWIISPTSTIHWIYSIKDGTFARYNTEEQFSNIVNNYPDTLIQSGVYVFSLIERPNVNNDNTDTYSALIKTRPMKLENAFALKSIMQMKHVFSNMANVNLVLRVQASNDLNSWTSVTSLRGTPYKYYKFRYSFIHMSATDTFSGTMLLTEERRTNKLR